MSDFGLAENTPRTVLEEARTRLHSGENWHVKNRHLGEAYWHEKVGQLGAVYILEGRVSPIPTKSVADELGVPEPTLFRNIPKPLVETMLTWGLEMIRREYLAKRHAALVVSAATLATDQKTTLPDSVSQWSQLYASIANPGALINIGDSMGQKSGNLLRDHLKAIRTSINILTLREHIVPPEHLASLVFAGVAAADRTPSMTLDQISDLTRHTIEAATIS